MEPQEKALRDHIAALIDGREPPEVFADWFSEITWLIRPPHMQELVLLVVATTARVALFSSGRCTGEELIASLVSTVAHVDKASGRPIDPLKARLPLASRARMRPIQEG